MPRALFLMSALIVMSSMPAVAQKPPASMKSCKAEKELTVRDPVTVLGPTGLVELRPVEQVASCIDPSTRNRASFWLRGLSDASGKIIVPAAYDEVIPFSTTHAWVMKGKAWARYDLARRKEEAVSPHFSENRVLAPTGACFRTTRYAPRGPAMLASYGPPGADGRRDVALYSGSSTPTMIRGIGGQGVDQPLQRHGDTIISRWRDIEGKLRSRILSAAGRPISPVLGETMLWSTIADIGTEDGNPACWGIASTDLFLVGPSLDFNPSEVRAGNLLIPIGPTGEPLPLPTGAIGMVALPRVTPDKLGRQPSGINGNDDFKTAAWGVVYPGSVGWEFTALRAAPAGVIAASLQAPRWSELARAEIGNMLFFQAKSLATGLWNNFLYLDWQPRGAPNADARVAAQAAFNDERGRIEASNAEQARAVAAARARQLADWQRMAAGPGVCGCSPPWSLGREFVTAHAEKCPEAFTLTDLNRLTSENYPADIRAHVQHTRDRGLLPTRPIGPDRRNSRAATCRLAAGKSRCASRVTAPFRMRANPNKTGSIPGARLIMRTGSGRSAPIDPRRTSACYRLRCKAGRPVAASFRLPKKSRRSGSL